MGASIFSEGMPHGLVAPMYRDGYGIQTGLVDPEFASALFDELRDNDQYDVGGAEERGRPGVHHNEAILSCLDRMPRLSEYLLTLNNTIIDVSGYRRQHLTYLTVRACPVGEMSTQIHRNDDIAGSWLIALTVAGSGSFGIYPDSVLRRGQEIPLKGDGSDPTPLAWSPMQTGDGWGINSLEWSAPHAGGPNTSTIPKVLVLLYGWGVRDKYPRQGQAQHRDDRPWGPDMH